MAYTPGLQIKARTRYRAVRTLPISGDVLVTPGEDVTADQIVARTHQPGELFPLNLANQLNLSPGDLSRAMQVQVGQKVRKGEVLAVSPGLFGFFRQEVVSPADGVIESISHVTGQVILRGPPIPVQVNAFVAGQVVEVHATSGATIETTAAFLQGIFGVGGEQQGTLRVVTSDPQSDLTADCLTEEHRHAIVAGGRKIDGAAVTRARELGVHALIAGGIDDQDLKEILGYDLGVAITGTETLGLTVIITEGFGKIAMAQRTFELLSSLQGRLASVNGATQIRAGVLRPEIVVPLTETAPVQEVAPRVGGGILQIGVPVRLIRDPWFGELGVVSALPVEPQVLESGSRARVLEVRCQSGRNVIVPRANVEIVGE